MITITGEQEGFWCPIDLFIIFASLGLTPDITTRARSIRDLIYDGGNRHARRPDAREEDGGVDTGRGSQWIELDTTNFVAKCDESGAWRGKPVTKQIEEFMDVYSFLFWQVGVGR